jgi:type I restriction enzyme S subunit
MNFKDLTLADLAAPQKNAIVGGPFGSNLVSKDYTETGVPVIRGGNMGEKWVGGNFVYVSNEKSIQLSQNIARPNDLVFTQRGTLGQVSIVPESGYDRYVVSQSQMKITVDPTKADVNFLYYLFNSLDQLKYIQNSAIQTGVPHTNLGILKITPVKIPPLNIQKQVASVLTGLDDRIALLRETNATLEAIAQAMFKSWFVDFDPVRAKQEGHEPEGMDGATAALFPDSFEESKLGLMPKGWHSATIEQVVEGVYDGPHATPPEADAGPVFLGIKNLTGTGIDLGTVRHIHEDQWDQWTRRVVPSHGDIVFSYEATLGFFSLIPPDIRCCLGRRLALIRPRNLNGCGHFWFHQFVAAPFQALLVKYTIQGATVNRIALKQFPSYLVLNPPIALQIVFDDFVAPLWEKIHSNQAKENTLVTLRDTLLPRLISGQLRLPDVDAIIEEAAA